jgi:hypothetical protein
MPAALKPDRKPAQQRRWEFARQMIMAPGKRADEIWAQVRGHAEVAPWMAVNASRELHHPETIKYMDELKGILVEEFKVTAKELYDKLEVLYETSLGGERPQVAAGVSAVMGQAKLMGLDKQVIDHVSSDGSMTPSIITLCGPDDDDEG